MTFGQTLSKVMAEKGIDAVTLSQLSGVNTPYISKLRKGKILDPTFTKAVALIIALGMTPTEFYELSQTESEADKQEA